MKKYLLGVAALAFLSATPALATICPTTVNTNSDCGYIITIAANGSITGAPVAGANPYDGSDDALVGVVNNESTAFTGSIALSGSGNGGGIFGFDGDGICTYTGDSYCSSSFATTGYEGPNNTFSGINGAGTAGNVVFNENGGIAAGGTTYFSLEGAPNSLVINTNPTPEPGSLVLFGSGLIGLAGVIRRKLAK